MRLLTIILPGVVLILAGVLIWRQDHEKLILTEEENKAWIANLIEKQLGDQLDLLRNRILSDTNVYFMHFGDRVFQKTEKDKYKSDGFCRPLLLVDGQPVYINNEKPTERIKALVKTLTTDNIKSVNVSDLKLETGSPMSTGLCAQIALTTKNRNVMKEVIRINSLIW